MKGHSVANLFRQTLSPLNPLKSILVPEERRLTLSNQDMIPCCRCMGRGLDAVADCDAEVMAASHNQESVPPSHFCVLQNLHSFKDWRKRKGVMAVVNYCRCVGRVLEAVADGNAELMVASHNQESVALATRRMHELGLQPSSSGAPHFALRCKPSASTIGRPPSKLAFTLLQGSHSRLALTASGSRYQ